MQNKEAIRSLLNEVVEKLPANYKKAFVRIYSDDLKGSVEEVISSLPANKLDQALRQASNALAGKESSNCKPENNICYKLIKDIYEADKHPSQIVMSHMDYIKLIRELKEMTHLYHEIVDVKKFNGVPIVIMPGEKIQVR